MMAWAIRRTHSGANSHPLAAEDYNAPEAAGSAIQRKASRGATLRLDKPDIELSDHALADLRKLVHVTMRTGDAQFGTAVKAVIRAFDTLQEEAKLEIRNMALYLYKENQNWVMSQIASLIRQDRDAPNGLEIREKFVAYLEYYKNIQYRMVDVIARQGLTVEVEGRNYAMATD